MRNYKQKWFIIFFLSIAGCSQTEKSELLDSPCVIFKPTSSAVIVGQNYTAEIFITCNKPDSTSQITLHTNLNDKLFFDKGHLFYEYKVEKPGHQSIKGEIEITKNGRLFKYPIEESIKGINTDFAISVENNNYLIKGKGNPIHVCVAGINTADVTALIMKGSLSKTNGDGNYIAIPSDDSDVVINIIATDLNEQIFFVGKKIFKVRDDK